jgi:ubiquinone/menaquinone biosynthesis C-methylase UbiE
MRYNQAEFQSALNTYSKAAWDNGTRVLQGSRLAPTDASHVAALLEYMAPPSGARILDCGCGFGEVARLMKSQRPDLDFALLNSNEFQLSVAPSVFQRVRADMHRVPLPAASFDGVMFCYSLCHAHLSRALTEAARVTKTGGFLFVYDYERLRGTNALFRARLMAAATPYPLAERRARSAGWVPLMHATPETDDSMFRAAYADDAEYDAIFGDLAVSVWKMVRA